MSATTWTPTALASEAFSWRGAGWRAVEAQHRIASMRLAANRLDDQALLEEILDQAKPPLAGPAAHAGMPSPEAPPAGRRSRQLHWLLTTPFRYRPTGAGSRFRRPGDAGVFYGAEERETACAEAGYWRLRFWVASAGLSARPASMELTLFQFHGAADRALDLTRIPLVSGRLHWTSPDDYTHTQRLADSARRAGVGILRYESVRRPEGICLAVLDTRVFLAVREPFRRVQETWTLHLDPPARVVWQRQLGNESWSFRFA